jgi:hypothetical protein
MARHLRIPGLIDQVSVEDPSEIRSLAENPRLDRQFQVNGPLINRLVTRRIRSILTHGGRRLPAVAPRGDPERARAQIELKQRLDAMAAAPCDQETLAMLAARVRGLGEDPALGVLAQQAVGRLFAPDYVANDRTWAAALTLDKAIRTRNPILSLIWHLTGRAQQATRVLAEGVNGDVAGIHATGIAVHNLVRGFERMRGLWADAMTPSASANSACDQCLFAPESVLRQATSSAETPIMNSRPGTLVLLKLEAARPYAPDLTFMIHSWAQCPAATVVPALLRAVWQRALVDGAE